MSLCGFLWGTCISIIFMAEMRAPDIFLRSEGEDLENFCDLNFLHQAPPTSFCEWSNTEEIYWHNDHEIRPFYKARAPVRLTQERPKCALHHGKMSTNKCHAKYEVTHEHVSNDLKMWIKRLHTEIHNIITIYIHHKFIYFKIITCMILGLVNSNVFACKTNSAFNDFVDSCV